MHRLQSTSFHSLPPELIQNVISRLHPRDQHAISLTSWRLRELALPFIFAYIELEQRLHFNKNENAIEVSSLQKSLEVLIGSGQNMRDAIRTVTVCRAYFPSAESRNIADNTLGLFQFLAALPNLQTLSIRIYPITVGFSHLSLLVGAVKSAPLLHLFLALEKNVASGSIVSGPENLETLSISWSIKDNANEPGSSLTHIYEFIRPSLRSLVRLDLYFIPNHQATKNDFDFTFLNSARQLRHFRYATYRRDSQIIRKVAEVLPNLETLGLDLGPTWKRAAWTDDYMDYLSLFRNLTVLELGLDLETAANDTEYAGHADFFCRSFFRRLEVTRKISERCPNIQRYEWTQSELDGEGGSGVHPFYVVEENGGLGKVGVVKPVLQWWMMDYVSAEGLQLPGDMVKEKFWWEREPDQLL